MKKHLFITGASGCGKTTLIRESLGAAAAYAGGFITGNIFSDDGRHIASALYPASAIIGTEGYDELRFLDFSGGTPVHDNEVFRTHATRMLKESVYYPFTLIDEIGGFEILIPQFREALTEIVNNDRPLIGVLKDKKSADALKQALGLSERFTMITDNLRNVLAADSDTTVITIHGRNDLVARRLVSRWVKEYVHI